jgi:hypothetical protein
MPIWMQRLLGGRPMMKVGYSFTDVVSGKRVYDWIDCFGRLWHSTNGWGWGRVQKGEGIALVESIREEKFYGV